MKKSYKDLNDQFEEINRAIKDIYEDISPKNKKENRNQMTLWERIFPGVLLVKTMEDISCQLDDILHITTKLSKDMKYDNGVEDNNESECNSDSPDPFGEDYIKSLQNDEEVEQDITDKASSNNEIEQCENKLNDSEIVILDESPSDLALDIIRLRDQLLLAKCSADEGTLRVIENLYKETGRILRQHGVESVDGVGDFNSQYQTIVDNKVTHNIELKDKVAESFKPGYRLGNRILRAQEVVLYKYEEES